MHTFLRMYVLLEPSSFSISLARSRDISSDAMLAKVQRPRPTTYILEWFISLVIHESWEDKVKDAERTS